MIYWKFKYSRTQRALAVGVSEACPNCKSPTVLKYIEFEDGEVWYNPQCEKCELMFKHNFKTKEESVIAWNENTKV